LRGVLGAGGVERGASSEMRGFFAALRMTTSFPLKAYNFYFAETTFVFITAALKRL
jgi:hypothetical protein